MNFFGSPLHQGAGVPPTLNNKNIVKPLLEKSFALSSAYEKSGKIVACWPVVNDPRVIMQQSAFTVHDTDVPLEDFAVENYLKKFIIPSHCKERLHKSLAICGIRLSSIFPEYEKISQQIKEEQAEDVEY